jgi:hypothetical protein
MLVFVSTIARSVMRVRAQERCYVLQRLLYVQNVQVLLPFSMGLMSLLMNRFGAVPPSWSTSKRFSTAFNPMIACPYDSVMPFKGARWVQRRSMQLPVDFMSSPPRNLCGSSLTFEGKGPEHMYTCGNPPVRDNNLLSRLNTIVEDAEGNTTYLLPRPSP